MTEKSVIVAILVGRGMIDKASNKPAIRPVTSIAR